MIIEWLKSAGFLGTAVSAADPLPTTDTGNATAMGTIADAAVQNPAASASEIALLKGLLWGGLSKVKGLTPVYINTAASGEYVPVALQASQTQRIHRIWFTAAGATTITFKTSAGGTIVGGADLQAGGSFTLDLSAEPHFVSVVAQAFIINNSNAVQLRGMLEYAQSA